MAFFSLRKGGDDTAATTGNSGLQPESIEAMRRRAKHRLIGASVLVLVGVVGFPLLFDTQPRPISVDIPIEIPDRNKSRPLGVPAAPVTQSTPSAAGSITSAPAPAPATAPSATPATAVAKVDAAPPAPAPAPKLEAKPEAKPETKPEAKPSKAPDDGTKAAALLEGKPVASTPVLSEGRYVVQVGAFSDVAKAREARLKLEHAGLKTYTQVVETKEGKRIRVRLGPFATKADADKAADKAKGLDLQPAVLTL